MTYGDLIDVVQVLNTGSSNPDKLDIITKLVLGKIAAKRIQSRIKTAVVTTGGLNKFQLGTASYVPDFLAPKTNGGNDNKFLYYNFSAGQPYFLPLVPWSNFIEYTEGGYCAIQGHTLYVSYISGITVPSVVNFPYYSKYMVLDSDGITEKEQPENNLDTFLLPSEFDSLIVDGVLLYITRREKDDGEFTKNVQEWDKSLNNMVFLN